jgi:hypothetical protein
MNKIDNLKKIFTQIEKRTGGKFSDEEKEKIIEIYGGDK